MIVNDDVESFIFQCSVFAKPDSGAKLFISRESWEVSCFDDDSTWLLTQYKFPDDNSLCKTHRPRLGKEEDVQVVSTGMRWLNHALMNPRDERNSSRESDKQGNTNSNLDKIYTKLVSSLIITPLFIVTIVFLFLFMIPHFEGVWWQLEKREDIIHHNILR